MLNLYEAKAKSAMVNTSLKIKNKNNSKFLKTST